MLLSLKAKIKTGKAQVMIEFTFSFIIVLILIYACVMAFRWAGASLASGRKSHDDQLTQGIEEDWGLLEGDEGPMKQTNPIFYEFEKLNMIHY